jgi:hypothetical protein
MSLGDKIWRATVSTWASAEELVASLIVGNTTIAKAAVIQQQQ